MMSLLRELMDRFVQDEGGRPVTSLGDQAAGVYTTSMLELLGRDPRLILPGCSSE